MKRTLSKKVRNELLTRFPNLDLYSGYWYFLYYLLVPTMVDEDSGRTVIPASLLARFEGPEKVSQLKHSNYNASKFLNAFKTDIAPNFEYTEADYLAGKAREVVCTGFDEELSTLRHLLLSDTSQEVEMTTGNIITPRLKAKNEAARKEDIGNYPSQPNRFSKEIIDYHLNLPEVTFSRELFANADKARLYLDKLIADEPDEIKHLIVRNQLEELLVHPKPLYVPVKYSARIYSYGISLSNIRKDVRKILTEGWVQYDLRSAQLAIIARDWGARKVQAFLKGGGSIWDYLSDELGVDKEAHKPYFKKALYSFAYGAGYDKIKNTLDAAPTSGLYEEFTNLDLIKDLLQARRSALEQIAFTNPDPEEQAVIQEVFGIYVSQSEDDHKKVLARRAQLTELLLLLPAYQLAREQPDKFAITAYLFDGFIVAYKPRTGIPKWEAKLIAAVNENAHLQGIYTYLERADS